MKPTEKKLEYIRLRAEGKSYRAIEAELGVSKSTCSEWEKELRPEIDSLRRENLQALYEAYGMTREARIRRIGDTLNRIDSALEGVDLSSLAPEKLLTLKLKYEEALRAEHSATPEAEEITGGAQDTLAAIIDLYRRTSAGETPVDKAKIELAILDHIVNGYQRANPFEAFM